jgi:hypothetical protein
MRKPSAISLCIPLLVAALLAPTLAPRAEGFSSATHLHIAEVAAGPYGANPDFWYGSASPDVAMYLRQPALWPTAFDDTHYDYIDLRADAGGPRDRAFAWGWITHNELWGADSVAHIHYPAGTGEGYVIQKARELSDLTGLAPGFSHIAVEVALDMLIREQDDTRLGRKLRQALTGRSPDDLSLLLDVLVNREGRTDAATLTAAESAFRLLQARYAEALALPPPVERWAMAELGVLLAWSLYGIDVPADRVLYLLETAMDICRDDYREAVAYTVDVLRDQLLPALQ